MPSPLYGARRAGGSTARRRVDATGARPLATSPLDGHQLGLVQQVKAVEQLTIEAARTGSPDLALKAFALHPLVDSVSVARDLVRGYGVG